MFSANLKVFSYFRDRNILLAKYPLLPVELWVYYAEVSKSVVLFMSITEFLIKEEILPLIIP